MKRLLLLSSVCLLLLLSAPALYANETTPTPTPEETCAVDIQTVMEEVEQTCIGIGRNQVCYGRTQVDAVPRVESRPLNFEQPGDSANVSLIRSLYLSELNQTNNTWGIAQMRLLANTSSAPLDINLLLFGNVSVDNAGEERSAVDVVVSVDTRANIRSQPSLNGLVVDAADPGKTLSAVGRLEDGSWLRVENPENGRVGWLSSSLVTISKPEQSLDTLLVDSPDKPYFGAMQAFYFDSTASGSCGSLVSDGLLIQTPEGLARVTLLINEVSIELVGSSTGGATALLQSTAGVGMNINMVSGSANVTAGGITTTVNTNQTASVPLGPDLKPTGAPTAPTASTGDLLTSSPVVQFAAASTSMGGNNSGNNKDNQGKGRENAPGQNKDDKGQGQGQGQGMGMGNPNPPGKNK